VRITLFALLALLLPAIAWAQVKIHIVETDPPSPAMLDHWESYYVRVGYDTDRPIRVRGDAFFNGKRVTSMTGGSPRYEPGSGDTMFWFAYTDPAKVDRIVIWAEDEQGSKSLAQAELAIDLTWTGRKPGAVRARPEWVGRIKAEHDRRAKQDLDAYMNRPTPWLETALFFAAAWSIPIYFIAQIVALRRLRGGWRIAAAVPAVPMALVLAHAIFAFFVGSNLFPIFLIFFCPVALIYLIVLVLVRRLRQPVTAGSLR
jgi:hypothetical protein